MKILAVESATSLCSVAFADQNGTRALSVNAVGLHSSAIFTQIRDLLADAQTTPSELDAVLLSAGPGSYTGLRVAASAIKGLLFGRNIPLYAVNTLAGFAAGVLDAPDFPNLDDSREVRIHAVIDARRVHLYAMTFTLRAGILWPHSNPEIIEIDEFEQSLRPNDILVGTGVNRLREDCLSGVKVYPIQSTSAKGLLYIYRMVSGETSPNFETSPHDKPSPNVETGPHDKTSPNVETGPHDTSDFAKRTAIRPLLWRVEADQFEPEYLNAPA